MSTDARPRHRSRARYAWREFLQVPVLIVVGWFVLAAVAIVLDRDVLRLAEPFRQAVAAVVPAKATSTLLSTITPGLLTLISIIFFVLIMAVQHQSSTYSPVVLDQFLRRRTNKIFFGMFVGLAIYSVLVLAMIPPGQAIVSGGLAILLSVLTFIVLLLFVYSAVDQLRPSATVWMMQQLALHARATQQPLLARCRRHAELDGEPSTVVIGSSTGYVVHIEATVLADALAEVTSEVEIELYIAMGEHVVPGGTLGEVRGGHPDERAMLVDAVLESLTLGRMRDIDRDAAQAVDNLGSMGWSATANAADPQGARIAVETLHSLLVAFQAQDVNQSPDDYGGQLSVVYRDDVIAEILNSLTSVIAASGQSGQHQTASTVLTILSRAVPHLESSNQQAALDRLQRVQSTAMSHVFTVEMEQAFDAMNRALFDSGLDAAARRIDELKSDMRRYNTFADPTQDSSEGEEAAPDVDQNVASEGDAAGASATGDTTPGKDR